MRMLLPVLALFVATDASAQSARVVVDLPPGSGAEHRLRSAGFALDHGGAGNYTGHPGHDPRTIEFFATPSELTRLDVLGLPYRVVERARPLREVLSPGAAPDSRFYTWNELNQEMAALEAQYPGLAVRVDLTVLTGSPPTHEGRHVYGLKISDDAAADEDEPNLLYVSNYHAREISTPAHMVEWMRHLLGSYGGDPLVTAAVDGHEIWVVPTMNPDGLEYVWNVDQWWRKNRRDNGGGVHGVDLNRNHAFRWAACGNYSTNPGSSTYAGPAPESEPETQTMVALARQRHFAKVVDAHTSGREILYPYTCASMPAQAAAPVQHYRDALASAANYSWRLASSGGEHFEWEFHELGALSYLIEHDTSFFPTWSGFLAEHVRVQPAYRAMLDAPIPLSGRVLDAATGAPIEGAALAVAGVTWLSGETRASGGPFGRYHLWLDDGAWDVSVSRAGFVDAEFSVTVPPSGAPERDVFLADAAAPHLSVGGTPGVGQQIHFRLDGAAAHAGDVVEMRLSLSDGGPFAAGHSAGGVHVPVDFDRATTWSLNHPAQMTATINVAGTAVTPWITLPPAAGGRTVWTAGIIHSGGVPVSATPALRWDVP